MRIWNFNSEKKENNSSIYFKFGFFGVIVAAIIIGGVKLFIWLIHVIIKYWLWVLGLMIAAFLIRWFFRRKKK